MPTHIRHLLLAALLAVTAALHAQDVVSVSDAVSIYNAASADKAKATLAKQGYAYKGVTGYEVKSHTWCKRVDLTRDYVPTAFEKGTSSIVELDTKGTTLCVYVFNRTAFETLKAEARSQGYEGDRKGDFFYKDDEPFLLFIEQAKPFPYLMQVSK